MDKLHPGWEGRKVCEHKSRVRSDTHNILDIQCYICRCVCVCMYVCMYVFVGLMLHPHAVGEGCGTRLPGEGGVGVEVPQEVVHSGTAQQSLQRLASSQGNTQ